MKSFWLWTLLLTLAGCAGTLDSPDLYEDHLARFNAAHPHTVHRVQRADGHHIQAREFNPSKKAVGPTLILMHGFPDNQHLYDRLIPVLSAHHHVVSFDFLGWGDSDKPPGHRYDVASQRADLDAVIRLLAGRQVVPVVHDLSGQAGIDWALDHETRTDALVLLNTYYLPMPSLVAPEAIRFYATPGWLRDLAVWGATRPGFNFRNGVRGQLVRFFSNPEAREAYLPVLTHGANAIRPAFFGSTSVLWSELAARQARAVDLKAFMKPVHVVFGADDPYLNPGVARSFAALFGRSSLTLVPGAGHYVQLDQAQAVGETLLQRLGSP